MTTPDLAAPTDAGADEVERHPCPHCKAGPGSPCRSRAGAVASLPHRPLHQGAPPGQAAARGDPRRPRPRPAVAGPVRPSRRPSRRTPRARTSHRLRQMFDADAGTPVAAGRPGRARGAGHPATTSPAHGRPASTSPSTRSYATGSSHNSRPDQQGPALRPISRVFRSHPSLVRCAARDQPAAARVASRVSYGCAGSAQRGK